MPCCECEMNDVVTVGDILYQWLSTRAQGYSNSSANALELLQSCTKLSILCYVDSSCLVIKYTRMIPL